MISGTDLHQFDVHNDCYFAHLPLNYVDGVILEMAVPRMSYEQLAESTSYMFDVEEAFGRLNLYLDHLDMNLSEYLSQSITYDMDDLVSKKIGPSQKELPTNGVDAWKDSILEDASDVVKTGRCTIEGDTETEYESDDESDYQSDKLVDYLSPGEYELIKLRNGMKANRKEKDKAKDKPDSGMNEANEKNRSGERKGNGAKFGQRDIGCLLLRKYTMKADHVPFVLASDAWPKCLGDVMLGISILVIASTINGIVEYLGDKIRANLNIRLRDIVDLVMKKYKCKGLIEAVKDVMPNAEHRQCARHIYENFRKQYPGWKLESDCCLNDEQNKGGLFSRKLETPGFWMWQLSGLPCVHATKVILLINKLLESYVPAWFETDMYFVTYHNYVKPVPSMNFWHDLSMYSTVLPPKPRKILGRPKKKRIRL
ncbi:hypothetical protein Tco_0652454 [Tanacetum coccineum]|uniref:Transposase n=1 Tax=Tanacetum coccineum TaxID=301880 RepID=A0ABQ4WY97_9ASTR